MITAQHLEFPLDELFLVDYENLFPAINAVINNNVLRSSYIKEKIEKKRNINWVTSF